MSTIQALSKKFNTLRDGDVKEKESVMKDLQQVLGKEGTPASELLEAMGPPDSMTPVLGQTPAVPTMPGPMMQATTGGSDSATPMYFVYHTAPQSESLCFKIDPKSEKVLTSEWHANQ